MSKDTNPPETAEQKVARLEKENAALREQANAGKFPVEMEKLIAEKTQAGLTREQAIAVVRDQQAFDKKLAEQEAARAKAAK